MFKFINVSKLYSFSLSGPMVTTLVWFRSCT